MIPHLAETQATFEHKPPQPTPSTPDIFTEPDPIRIYVACLAAYNNGHLHGSWIEVTDEAAIWQAVQNMLAASPIEEDAEEWAIHDYEGFAGAEVGEYFSFANVVELAEYITERGELGAEVPHHYFFESIQNHEFNYFSPIIRIMGAFFSIITFSIFK
jgi:antirestriction protein